MNCPTGKDWNKLLKQIGDKHLAYWTWLTYGESLPESFKSTSVLKAEFGIRPNMSALAKNMAFNKIGIFNTKYNTSMRANPVRVGEALTWNLELMVNYLPTSEEKKRQDAIKAKGDRVVHPLDSIAYGGVKEMKTVTPKDVIDYRGIIEYELPQGQYRPKGFYKGDRALEFQESKELVKEQEMDLMLPTSIAAFKTNEQKKVTVLTNELGEVKKELSNTTDSRQRRMLNNKLESLTERIEGLRASIASKKSIELGALEEQFNQDYSYISSILESGNPTPKEVELGLYLLSFWQEVADVKADTPHFLLDVTEVASDEIRESVIVMAHKLIGEFTAPLVTAQEALILDFVRKNTTSTHLTDKEVMSFVTDVTGETAQFLNLGKAPQGILQGLFSGINNINLGKVRELNKIVVEIDGLQKTFKSTGLDQRLFFQVDGEGNPTSRLVQPFSTSFFATRKSYQKKVADLRVVLGIATTEKDKKDILIKLKKAEKEYADWRTENTIRLDIRAFLEDNPKGTAIPENFRHFNPLTEVEKNTHLTELKKLLGEKEFEVYKEKAKRRLQAYQDKRELVYANLLEDGELSEAKELEFINFINEFSPFVLEESFDNLVTGGVLYHKYNYTISIPSKEEYYDKNFRTIQSNKAAYEVWSYADRLAKSLHHMLGDKANDLGYTMLPLIQAELGSQFLNSLHSGRAFLDWMKEMVRSNEVTDYTSSDINPKTGRPIKDFNTPALNTNLIERDVNSQYLILADKYRKDNGLAATDSINAPTKVRLKAEARRIVYDRGTKDFFTLLKAYTGLAMGVAHKQKIAPVVRMIEDYVEELQVAEKTVSGRIRLIADTNTPNKIAKAENAIKMLNYFTNNEFWGYKTKKDESVLGSPMRVLTSKEKEELASIEKELESIRTKLDSLRSKRGELETSLESIPEEVDEEIALLETQEKSLVNQLKSIGGTLPTSTIVDGALKFTQLLGLGFSVPSSISNLAFGYISNIIRAGDGRDFSFKEFTEAQRYVSQSHLAFASGNVLKGEGAKKLRALADGFNLIRDSSRELFDTEFARKAKMFSPWNWMEKSEYVNQITVMTAMMLKTRATLEDGRVVSLFSTYNSKGELAEKVVSIENNGKQEPFDEVVYMNRVRHIIEETHGDYNHSVLFKSAALGRALSQFRTWIFRGISSRFESEREDLIMGYTRKGRYISMAQLLRNKLEIVDDAKHSVLDNFLYYLTSFMSKERLGKRFTEVDAANMRAFTTEVMVYIAMTALIALLKAQYDDDEEKEGLAIFTLNQLNRWQNDISFYINPLEAKRIITSPLPFLKVFYRTAKIGAGLPGLFDDTNDIEWGPFDKVDPTIVDMIKIVPIIAAPAKIIEQVDKEYE